MDAFAAFPSARGNCKQKLRIQLQKLLFGAFLRKIYRQPINLEEFYERCQFVPVVFPTTMEERARIRAIFTYLVASAENRTGCYLRSLLLQTNINLVARRIYWIHFFSVSKWKFRTEPVTELPGQDDEIQFLLRYEYPNSHSRFNVLKAPT